MWGQHPPPVLPTPNWGCFLRGTRSCSLTPTDRPNSVVQEDAPTHPWAASLGTPCPARTPQGSSWHHPALPSAFLRPHTLPTSCLPGASPRPESPRGPAGDGRPTIAHKGRMSPQSLPPARLRGNLPREERAPPDARRPRSFVLLTLGRSDTWPWSPQGWPVSPPRPGGGSGCH